MNIEAAIIQYLSEQLPDVHVAGDVPNPRPDRVISVERTGGGSDNIVLDHPELSLLIWDESKEKASNLAYEVDRLLSEWDDPRVVDLDRSGLFDFPDSDGHPRYQITLEGIVYL